MNSTLENAKVMEYQDNLMAVITIIIIRIQWWIQAGGAVQAQGGAGGGLQINLAITKLITVQPLTDIKQCLMIL